MTITIQAEKRTGRSKSVNRTIRRLGKVPAVVYGKDTENVTIAVDEARISKVLRDEGQNAVLTLDVQDDKTYQVMVNDIQRHPLNDALLHIDFQSIRMDEPVTSDVPIEVVGDKDGLVDGGIVQQQLRTLQIRALPNNIPDTIVYSVENLTVGDTITVAQLAIPEGVEVLSDADDVVVTIIPQTGDTVTESDAIEEPKLVEQTTDDGQVEND